ncbi:hypothetical protein HS088_TW13G00730 [Tripterygium wilfordii]|uniref:Uncharacterized protein n=1 Tax=Tripterygium wilfordii TaxID=458696 RepID=A0A7J7CV46_TRIWF|nr:uncharacterized protein LOC120012545 [Tripterygium wilfordii]KAF5737839.1 hypothetical protein HS088_TW13G00730 [Tripterygium wilfordii]
MQATKISFPSTPTVRPTSFNFGRWRRVSNSQIVVSVRGTDDREYDGRLVDDDMSTLRVRIREMKVQEERKNVPSDWMEWEKQYYSVDYCVDVGEAMGLLQKNLLNTRPSLALGIVAFVFLSVLMSSGMVLVCALELVKKIIVLGSQIG